MTLSRAFSALCLSLCLAVSAGCAGTGSSSAGAGAVSTSGGGYYKDDGPGDNIPANIAAIPDAVPKIETHRPANFRPYRVMGKRYVPISNERSFRQEGNASWYGRKFHGKLTANGEKYDMYAMTAAHPTLPLPSYARVTRVKNGKSVIVRINDRGPFHSSRIIDLSYVAAAKLGLIGPGSDKVIVEAITNQEIRDGIEPPRAKPIPPAMPAPPPTLMTDASPTPTLRIQEANGSQPAPASGHATHTQTNTEPDPLTQWLAARNSAMDSAMADMNTGATRAPETAPGSPNATTAAAQGTEQPVHDTPASPGDAPPATSLLTHASPAGNPGTTPQGDDSGLETQQLYLQFGAFSAAQSATLLAQRLNAQIAGVEPRNAKVQAGNSLYRVRIGPYASRTAAVNAAVRIQQATGLSSTMASR